jgi:c-di-GMP-binding flagellar brake protein YcgR
MHDDTLPAPLGDAGDGMDEFRVTAPAEVLALLRRLLEGGCDLVLSAPGGVHLRSSLWTVDADRGWLSLAADLGDPQLERLIDAGEATAVGYLDSVKLQFELGPLLLVRGAAAATLQSRMPGRLFRFQRRQGFRVRTPRAGAVVALLRHPAMPEMALTLRVIDLSIGGCALFLPDDVPPLAPGTRLQGVRIELDGATHFAATLELRHVTSLHADSGGVRLGCALHDLGSDALRALQRYIDLTQKRRRLLALG